MRGSAVRGINRVNPLPQAGIKPAPTFSWVGVTGTLVMSVYERIRFGRGFWERKRQRTEQDVVLFRKMNLGEASLAIPFAYATEISQVLKVQNGGDRKQEIWGNCRYDFAEGHHC